MKKKFLLWLCKSLKVELVEPINQVNQVHYVHEVVPYTLIQDTVKLYPDLIPKQDLENVINQAKAEMVMRCAQRLEKENLLRFDQFEEHMNEKFPSKGGFYKFTF
jgi:hypothetical protein